MNGRVTRRGQPGGLPRDRGPAPRRSRNDRLNAVADFAGGPAGFEVDEAGVGAGGSNDGEDGFVAGVVKEDLAFGGAEADFVEDTGGEAVTDAAAEAGSGGGKGGNAGGVAIVLQGMRDGLAIVGSQENTLEFGHGGFQVIDVFLDLF